MTKPTPTEPTTGTNAKENLTATAAFKRAEQLVLEAATYCAVIKPDHLDILTDHLIAAAGEATPAQRARHTGKGNPLARGPNNNSAGPQERVICAHCKREYSREDHEVHLCIEQRRPPGEILSGAPGLGKRR